MADERIGSPDFAPGAPGFITTPRPASFTWQFVDSPLGFTSPFTGQTQTKATFGGLWTGSASWNGFERHDLAPLFSKLSYYGVTRSFTIYMFDQGEPQAKRLESSATERDSLVVNADATQTGFELNVVASADHEVFLSAGDVIGFIDPQSRPQMFQLYEDLEISGGTGVASLSQPIRTSPAAGAQILSSFVPVRVRQAHMPKVAIDSTVIYQFDASFFEVIT